MGRKADLPSQRRGTANSPKCIQWSHHDVSLQDVELARARMKAAGRAEAEPWTKAKAKRIFSSWHIYVFPLLYVIWVS